MNFEQFKASLGQDEPPALPQPETALWYAGKGDWDIAHEIAQLDTSAHGAWVHAYLHRQEGDLGNAAYWYRRAGRQPFTGPLNDEWTEMVTHFLDGYLP